jgi:hypothetical protein
VGAGYRIGLHLPGACNDSGKQPDKSGDYKNMEVKYEGNTWFEETPSRGKGKHLFFDHGNFGLGNDRLYYGP